MSTTDRHDQPDTDGYERIGYFDLENDNGETEGCIYDRERPSAYLQAPERFVIDLENAT